MLKTLNSSDFGGFISYAPYVNDSFSLEKSEKIGNVKSIRLLGTVKINSEEYVNPFVEDLPGAVVQYHQNRPMQIATVYFPGGIAEELMIAICNYEIQDFEVFVETKCPCCGG